MQDNIEELPKQIGKYEQLYLIGKGGCAKVFKAFDPDLERWVALKLLDKRLTADHAMREQFFKEIKTQAALNIPGIIRVFDSGESSYGLFYTMELVNGVSLEKYCWQNPLELETKFSLLHKVALIISELHKKNIIHRDIKPRNVMIDEYDHVKLLDLGLVTLLDEEISLIADFKISGSPAYMPPEALVDKNVNSFTPAADIYSLSVMAYEMICGYLPYDVEFLKLKELAEVIHNEAPKHMETPFEEKIPLQIKELILSGLCPNPAERPTIDEFSEKMFKYSKAKNNNGSWKLTTILTGIGAAVFILALLAVMGIHHARMGAVAGSGLGCDFPDPPPELVNQEVETTEVDKIVEKKVIPVEVIKEKPVEVKIIQKAFYKNSAPEHLKQQWLALKSELNIDPAFKNMGALYYYLPEKCTAVFRSDKGVMRSIDSRFEKSGSFFYNSGRKVKIEIKSSAWNSPFSIDWESCAGSVDVLCPTKDSINQNTGD